MHEAPSPFTVRAFSFPDIPVARETSRPLQGHAVEIIAAIMSHAEVTPGVDCAADSSSSPQCEVLWAAARGREDLGTLGGANSAGVGIGQSGEVVGISETAAGPTEAFLWTPTRGMRSLGTLDGSFSLAFSVNTHRRVVGVSGGPFLWPDCGHDCGPLHALDADRRPPRRRTQRQGPSTRSHRGSKLTPGCEDGLVRPRAKAGRPFTVGGCCGPGMPRSVMIRSFTLDGLDEGQCALNLTSPRAASRVT